MIYLQVSFKIATKLKNKMERSTDELASSHGSDLHRSNYLGKNKNKNFCLLTLNVSQFLHSEPK